MSDTLLVAIVSSASVVIAAAIGLAVAWVDRRSKHRTAEAAKTAADASDKAAEAAEKAAEAAADEARAQMLKAIVAAREQASADWARYCDAQQRWNEHNDERITRNAQEIEDAKLRILEAEQRAYDWEKLFQKTKIYVRKLILWIQETVPHEEYPAPPPELELDL